MKKLSPANWCVVHLKNLGILSDSWPGFIGQMPSSPDNTVSFHDTAGKISGRNNRDGVTEEKPGVAVIVRSSSYTDGYTKVKEIADAFDSTLRVDLYTTVDGQEYHRNIFAIHRGQVFSLGRDVEQSSRTRWKFSVNSIVSFGDN